MTIENKTMLIDSLRKISQCIADIALALEDAPEAASESVEAPRTADPVVDSRKPEQPAKTYSYEEARAVLADKARLGFRAEVKALLTAHGVKQLSDISDPAVFATIIAEAEEIGNV